MDSVNISLTKFFDQAGRKFDTEHSRRDVPQNDSVVFFRVSHYSAETAYIRPLLGISQLLGVEIADFSSETGFQGLLK